MVYWDFYPNGKLKPSYNPLLLRLAAKVELPLPVFSPPDAWNTPNSIVERLPMRLMVSNSTPTIVMYRQGLELMDLQQWLTHRICTQYFNNAVTAEGGKEDAKGVIAMIANTIGGAHYDEAVPKLVDGLLSIGSDGYTFLRDFLLSTAKTIVELGMYLLSIYNNKKLLPYYEDESNVAQIYWTVRGCPE